jgi:signal transduction histidine kinase
MGVASSLTNRIFIASTALALLSLGFAFYFVNARASAEAEAELRRGLAEAATLFDLRRASLSDTFTAMARLIADLPKLKAAVATGDPPTVQPIADEYRVQIGVDLLMLAGSDGRTLAVSGRDAGALRELAQSGALGSEGSRFIAHPRGLLQVVTVPILIVTDTAERLGRLSVGFFMDDTQATMLKDLTGSEIAFVSGDRVLASSLPTPFHAVLAGIDPGADIATVTLGDEEYLALARPMLPAGTFAPHEGGEAPVTLVLRSRTERLRFLDTLRAGLAGALIVTVLLATILSYFVARTVTRPLSAVTSAMRDVAATGDLTRKVTLRSRAWDDEDARLLASAFNTLTESIARFQRHAAQKERLSSLGRLSTVIAHEVRNPLMIIRASLSTLRRGRVSAAELRDAVADIDEETTRLNRIVTEVLDFARPVRFDLAEASVNDICRASTAAAWAGEPEPRVDLDLDPDLPPIVTDSERLRTALVNILTNARQAAESAEGEDRKVAAGAAGRARSGAEPRHEPVLVTTRRRGDRIAVTVRDRGNGISHEDMAHIFDPYFTTRRAGTGLGLPISKNIVEGLGGTIAVSSRRGEGTEIRIDLPLTAPEAAA